MARDARRGSRRVQRGLRGAVVISLVAAGIGVSTGTASARSLFPVGCDETSYADEDQLIGYIEAANDEAHHPGNDLITLTAGCTYTLTQPIDPYYSGTPAVESDITINGNGATVQGQSPDYVSSLFAVSAVGDLKMLDLTLSHGGIAPSGGGAVRSLGYLTLDRVTVDGNAGGVGASGPTTIRDSVFSNNYDINSRGGALSAGSSLVVERTSFVDNWTHQDSDPRAHGSGGSAIYLSPDAGAFITDSTFSSNDTNVAGGAIYNDGTLGVTRSTFSANTAQIGGAIFTGGFYSVGAPLTVDASYFTANRADYGGAVLARTTTSVTNSTFYANQATFSGGAIMQDSLAVGALSVTSSTFASNVVGEAHHTGEAVLQYTTSGQTSFSVFAGQTSNCAGVQDGGGNLVDRSDTSCPTGFQVGSPSLQPPAMNGGPTMTMRLGTGSSALNRIASGCPTKDQRGFDRPSGAACDAGAYEDQAPTTPGTPAVTSGTNPTKTGALTLSWTGSTDADDTVSYRLLRKDANDATYSVFHTTPTTSVSFTESEGTWSYKVEAVGGPQATPSGTLTGIVVDKSAPLTPTLSADRAPDYAPATGTSWYRDTVTVTTLSNGDPALADTSAGSGVASVTAPSTYSTSGTSTYTSTATDAAGNVSPSASLTVNVDAEDPTIGFATCPATVLLKHPTSLSWSASDPSSGLVTPAAGSVPLDTATVGHKSVSTTATDHVGHSTTATCAYDVIFDFTGFFDPVTNAPLANKAAAGQVVTLAFSLAGSQGLGVIAPGYPVSTATSCSDYGQQTSGSPTSAVKPGLTFSQGSGGRYSYPWQTQKSWRGTCRQFVLKLTDGTYHRANFAFS